MLVRRGLIGAYSLAVALLPGLGAAQDNSTGPGTRLSIRAGAFYTDNFYNSSATETSVAGAIIAPELKFIAQTRKLDFTSVLNAEYGAFNTPGSQDNYLDGGIDVRLGIQATARNQLRLGAGYRAGHDSFGVDRTENAAVRDVDLDQWGQKSGSLHYRYGAAGALVNAEVGFSTAQRDYTTNRNATRFLDYDATTASYALFYNYSPKTSALIDFERTNYEFDAALCVAPCDDPRGGELYRTRVGLRWLATGKTSGDVRVGYRLRTFDASSADLEGLDWEAAVQWAPVPRSTLRFQTAHSEQQSYTAIARVIDVESAAIDWRHNLTARMRSSLRVEHIRAGFEGSTRDDETTSVTGGLERLALSYLWVVGNVGMTQRDSTVVGREYDRLHAFVGVRLGR